MPTTAPEESPRCNRPCCCLCWCQPLPSTASAAGKPSGLDLILFFCAGIAGCILAFLALFSQHPAVSPNYLLFVFHPLHLFCLPWMINKVRKRQKSWYMRANCAVLTLFILLWAIIPQRIDLAVLPLALCLLVRSASNLILTLKKR